MEESVSTQMFSLENIVEYGLESGASFLIILCCGLIISAGASAWINYLLYDNPYGHQHKPTMLFGSMLTLVMAVAGSLFSLYIYTMQELGQIPNYNSYNPTGAPAIVSVITIVMIMAVIIISAATKKGPRKKTR